MPKLEPMELVADCAHSLMVPLARMMAPCAFTLDTCTEGFVGSLLIRTHLPLGRYLYPIPICASWRLDVINECAFTSDICIQGSESTGQDNSILDI